MKNSNAWEKFPDELKDMFVLLKKGNIYVISGIIDYLLQHRTKVYSDASETQYLVWVDRFVADCLYPYEFCVDLWKDHSAQLEEILDYGERLITKLDENKNLNISPKTENNTETDLVVLSQHWDVYFCTLYQVHDRRDDEYALRLRKILATTRRNIEYMLSSPHVSDLYKLNITLHGDLNIMGAEYFEEPLSFTVNELASFDDSVENLAKVYAEYYDFLNKYECQAKEAKIVLSKLKAKAQERLNNLCTYALGYIDEEIQIAYEDIQKMIDSRLKFETQIYGGTDNDN